MVFLSNPTPGGSRERSTILYTCTRASLPLVSQVGELLLCEHPPVYTFGLREQSNTGRERQLLALGAEVCKVHNTNCYVLEGGADTVV